MTYQPKSYKKFIATAATATVVASAIAPAAMAAGFTDVSEKYQDAVDFVVSKGANGLSETQFGVHENIKRVDAAVLLVKVLGLDYENAAPSGFTDVPERAVQYVNALKEAGITNGKSATTFDSHSLITRGELAVWIQRGFELIGENEVPFTDVAAQYEEAVSALVDNGITNGVSETQFGTYQNAKRGDYAILLLRAFEASNNSQAPAYEVKSNEVVLTNIDENVLNTLFDGTVLDFGSTDVTVTDVDFVSDNETIIVDNDAVKEGTVAVSDKYNGNTSIYVDTVTVNVDQTNETFVLDLNDLQVDVSLKAHDSKYVNLGVDKTSKLDYISINMHFQNDFDKKVTALEVSLLDAEGEVVATNKANPLALLVYVNPAVKNNSSLTTTFWEDTSITSGSWQMTYYGSLQEAVKAQVTFTADGASYVSSIDFNK